MRAIRIIVTAADPERLRGALMIASAQAALGGEAALFLQLEAAGLLRAPIASPADADHRAAGLPALDAVLTESLALGVTVSVCQSGLALCGMSAGDLPHGVEAGGPIGFLAETGDEARLLIA